MVRFGSMTNGATSTILAQRLTGPSAALVVLAVFYAVLIAGVRDKSATIDEPGHAVAGYVYWKYGNFHLAPEAGNLPQRWVALPLVTDQFRFPAESAALREGNVWALADEWFNRSGNNTEAMLFRGRALSGLLAVALGFAVWAWSRRLFGPIGAMISLLLFVTNPGILANGALMKDDLAGALFFLTACGIFWAMLERPTLGRVLVSGAATGVLFVTKGSALLFLPMAAAMVTGSFFLPTTQRPRAIARLAGALAIQAIMIVAVIWAAFGFRFAAWDAARGGPAQFGLPWEWALNKPHHLALLNALGLDAEQGRRARELLNQHAAPDGQWSHAALAALQDIRASVLTPSQSAQLERLRQAPPPGAPARVIAFAREHRLLPEAYLFGLADTWRNSAERTAFFNGQFSSTGWRTFFPCVFAVKTPLAALALLGFALAGAWAWRTSRRNSGESGEAPRWAATLPLWVLFAVYWAAAIASHINIGHRHLLPIYPPLFILGGAAGLWFALPPQRARRFTVPAIAGLIVVLLVETAAWFPNYLAYFNGLVTPSSAYRHLVDSSLDWGQDLPAAKRYVDRLPRDTPVYLAFFGVGSPLHHGIEARQIYRFGAVEKPVLHVLRGLTPERDAEKIAEFLRREPRYDPALLGRANLAAGPSTLLLLRGTELRLGTGTYLISATLMQPVNFPHVFGAWNASHEATYQDLRARVRPFLSDDRATRAAALERVNPLELQQAFALYYEFRLARLTAFLRQREPDDAINYSILVFRLTDADITRALDGPPP